MASTHKHIRSSTASKRPTTAIADGQIALNTNSATPGLFFKDSTGATIIKVGPVHVGTTAPNATPAAGGSSGNSTGEVWLDTSLTPPGVKIWNGSAWVNGTPAGSTTVQGLLELATNAETQTGSDTARAVTPAGLQSKVSDSVSTTSSTTIASSTAVKTAYDLADAALPKAGGTVTGNLEIGTTGSLTFEGATADAFETTLAVTDPTADRTITLPDVSGTVVTTGDTGTVTSTMIADGTIVNNDVNASAAIAYSKLALTGSIVDADVNASAEIAVSKLADGAARQLLQTDAAGTGVEWTSNVDIPGTLDVTGAAVFDSTANIAGNLTVDTNTLFVDATNNRVGIGTTTPETELDVRGVLQIKNAGTNTIRLNNTTTNYWDIQNDSNLRFSRGGSEYARLTSDGKLLVGTSSARTNFFGASQSALFQTESNVATSQINTFTFNEATTGGPYLVLVKTRSSSIGGTTIVNSGDQIGAISFQGTDGTAPIEGARIQAFSDGTPGANDMPGALVFSTTADGASSPTERMRIQNSGLTIVRAEDNTFYATSNAAAGTTTSTILAGHSATGMGLFTVSFRVYTNGNVQNTNNSYGSLSDIKLKENIADAKSQWDDLKALRVVNYNFKPETGAETFKQLGLIAQEVELVSPGLVTESPDRDEEGNDLGTTTKSVNYSVLYMKAVKALQEAMERIEVLESKVNTLEAA